MIAVIEDKRHAVDAIAGRARRLVDQNAADHLIGQHNGGALAVLDLEINGCTVKLVFGICHRFNGIVAAVLELCERLTALRRHERRDQRTVESADLDGRIGDAHTAIILIHLDKLDLADRRIVIAIGNPPLLSQLDWDSQGGLSPASHRACDFHRTRRSINANYLLRVCEITSLSL